MNPCKNLFLGGKKGDLLLPMEKPQQKHCVLNKDSVLAVAPGTTGVH